MIPNRPPPGRRSASLSALCVPYPPPCDVRIRRQLSDPSFEQPQSPPPSSLDHPDLWFPRPRRGLRLGAGDLHRVARRIVCDLKYPCRGVTQRGEESLPARGTLRRWTRHQRRDADADQTLQRRNDQPEDTDGLAGRGFIAEEWIQQS